MHVYFTAVLLLLVSLTGVRVAPPDEKEADCPDTPAGRELRWVMQVLNGATIGDAAMKFSPRFLEDTPAARIADSIKDIRENAFKSKKVRLDSVEENSNDYSISAFISGDRRQLSVFIAIDRKTMLIDGLLFAPAGYWMGDVGDWDAFNGEIGKLTGKAAFGVYELVEPAQPGDAGTRPRPPYLVNIHSLNEEERLNIGTAFEMHVLLALCDQVRQGKASWDEKLRIRDEFKSLPNGTMQEEPDGAEFTIRTYARKMFALGDNTAADHLVERLGRPAVEACFKRFSVSPGKSLPLLSTRDWFRLKVGDDEARERYIAADEAARREMLSPGGVIASQPLPAAAARRWASPVEVDRLGWFLSVEELASTWIALRDAEQDPALHPLRHVLSADPGIQIDGQTWKTVYHKEGNEPGVLCMSWLLERADGRRFIFAIIWNNPLEVLEDERMIALVSKGFEILAAYKVKPQAGGN